MNNQRKGPPWNSGPRICWVIVRPTLDAVGFAYWISNHPIGLLSSFVFLLAANHTPVYYNRTTVFSYESAQYFCFRFKNIQYF